MSANKPAKKLIRKRTLLFCSLAAVLILAGFAVEFHRGAGSGKFLSNVAGLSSVHAKTDEPAMAVSRGDLKKTLIIVGELRAVRSQSIYAVTEDEAKITYMAPEGSIIKPGERVLELDSSTALTKIKDIEEKIVAADNDIVKTQSTNESALQDMQVQLSQLWLPYEQAKVDAKVPPGVEARRTYQEKQFNLAKAKADYDNQLEKIEQKKKEQAADLQVKVIEKQKLEAQLSQAKGDLDGMNVKSPAEGMVIYSDHWSERRKIQVGDIVWSGFPIITLPDLKEMEVLAKVNEVDGPKLSVGQTATVTLDSYPDIQITGTVKNIAQTAVKANWMGKSRIFNVVISLDKTVTEIMKPGMSAQVTVGTGDYPSQLIIPRTAVQFEGGAPQVVRVEDQGKRRTVAVTIIASDSFSYAVADNGVLKEGDHILRQQ